MDKTLPIQPKDFKLKKDEKLSTFGWDITTDDVLLNKIGKHNQLCQKNGVPWHGAGDKEFVLMFTLICACYVFGDVRDLIANTCMLMHSIKVFSIILTMRSFGEVHKKLYLMIGTSICVCWNKYKHILALEGNNEIFDIILKPSMNYHLDRGLVDSLDVQDHMLEDDEDMGSIIEHHH